MEQPPHTTETDAVRAAELVRQLGSRNHAERDNAEKTLRRMGPDAVEPLLTLMQEQADRLTVRLRFSKRLRRVALVTLLGWFVLPSFPAYPHLVFLYYMHRLFGIYNIAWYTYHLFFEYWFTSGTQQYRKAMDIVADADDLRVVGTLSRFLEWNAASKGILTCLLPRMQRTDAHLLNVEQRVCLYKQLRRNTRNVFFLPDRNAELSLAILKALEQIGDASALPYVAQAAKTARSSAVRQAARECLPYLAYRAEGERAANSLLRASASTSVPDATLLRAAQSLPETAPQQLLRAAASDDV